METILFRGVFVRHFDERRKGEVGVFTRIHLTADPSQPVFAAMGWEDVPDCVGSGAPLIGELVCRSLTLTPIDPGLGKQAIALTCIEASDFELARVKAKDGESSSSELRFSVRSQASEAAALLSNWMRTIGEGRATLKLDYSAVNRAAKKETAQDEAPLFAQASSAEQADPGTAELVLKDDEGNVVRRFESVEEKERAGLKLEPGPKEFSLPTARQAAGRTPHLGTRKAGRPVKGNREVQ
jgi:hypothetical protein